MAEEKESESQESGDRGQESDERVNEVIAAYLAAVAAGEKADPQEWLTRHPDLADELRSFFADMAHFEGFARSLARAAPVGTRSAMHITCPHCKNAIELVEQASPPASQEILCPSCGSSFRLAEGSTTGYAPTAGKKLGKFELIDIVGVGAFGTV